MSSDRRRHLDGRVARGQQSRTAITEALVHLVDAGVPAPTIQQVAERAGVSVRLVFHHFRTAHGLQAAAVALQAERFRHVLFAVPPRGPPELRTRALCRQRRLYFEALAPTRRMAGVGGAADPALHALLTEDRVRMRQQLADTFAPEMAGRGTDAVALLDALDQATGWEAWLALRDVRDHSAATAERAMAFTTLRLLT